MIVEFSITPIGVGESLSAYLAKALDIVDKSGLDYRLTAMGTIVEGDWDEVMALIKRCHEAVKERCNRVDTLIKIDDRKGKNGLISAKVKSLEDKLGRELKK